MPAGVDRIWLPGAGMTDVAERRADAFVQEYDPNLRFGRNEDTGQYCVFRIVRGEKPLPILGFPPEMEVPSNEFIGRRLYETDAVRRGNEILDEMNRHNEALERAEERKAEEAAEIAAEGFEWLMRDQGQTPYKRVYTGNVKKNAMGGYS